MELESSADVSSLSIDANRIKREHVSEVEGQRPISYLTCDTCSLSVCCPKRDKKEDVSSCYRKRDLG